MKKWIVIYVVLVMSVSGIFAEDKYPVRGFPTGEEVLNKKSVPYKQVEPHLEYKENGFRSDLLKPVPAPGVHPRVVMSPEDVPNIRRNIENNSFSKRVWERLVLKEVQDGKGNLKPIDQVKRLDAAALYALVTDDAQYGKIVAAALVKKAAEVDAKLDKIDSTHPYPQHWWFSVRNIGIQGVAAAYDYDYNFMTDDQRAKVRKVISKATVGRYNHGMELPRAWRTWNWPQFSQSIVNTALAIEGEEGYEPRILDVCKESVVDFLTYKISPEGWDFESTGYNGLAYGGGGVQAIHAIARRTTPSALMHPHVQAQTAAYIGQQGGPNGPWFGRGDSLGGPPQFEFTHLMRAFYPDDPRWNMTWTASRNEAGMAPTERYKLNLRNSLGIPLLIYAVDEKVDPLDSWGADKDYQLTYDAPSRGYMATRSDWNPTNSIHMSFSVYNKLRDTGHDGPDAGTISVWGQGMDWTLKGDKYHKCSAWRAYVAIDGGGMGYGTAPGLFMPVADQPQATAARGDMSYSFSWRLVNGRYNVLYSPLFQEDPGNYLNGWAREAVKHLRNKESDPTPFLKEFWSLASPNYGLWNGEDRHPTRRVVNLPVERAFRSATLVRGDSALNNGNGYPYVLTVDDIQVDEDKHLYTWLLPLAGKNEVISKTSDRDARSTDILVRRIPKLGKGEKDSGLRKGDSVLFVSVLQRNFRGYPSISLDTDQGDGNRQRIVVSSISVTPDFKVLIYPHRYGDPLPITSWNPGKTKLKVEIDTQIDTIDFSKAYVDRRPFGGYGDETYFTVSRNGEKVITVGGPPSLPCFADADQDFDGSMKVAFKPTQPGETIRYTTNGNEPTRNSNLYSGPFEIKESTTVKAVTYAPDWKFGDKESVGYKELVSENFIVNKQAEYRMLVSRVDEKVSPPVAAVYTRVSPKAPSVKVDEVVSGVELNVYELPITFWRGTAIDMESPLMPKDLSKERPIFSTYQKNLSIPRVQPTVETSKMYQGVYVISGYFNAETQGQYNFEMTSCGPTRLTVGGKELINVPGPYETMLRERKGEVILEKGLHSFEVIFTDPSFFVNQLIPVIGFGLQVKAPDSLTFKDVAPSELFRNKDFGFNIADTIIEVGTPLKLRNDKPGTKLEISLDGGKRYKTYKKPITFKKVETVNIMVRRPGEDMPISKPISVVERLPALKDVLSLTRGMIQQRYLRPVKAEFDQNIDHNNTSNGQIISHPKNPKEDIFAFVGKAHPEETIIVSEMIPDNVGGVIRQYIGYWWAPKAGLYTFTMLNEGSNKLMIDDVHISSNHNLDAKPEGKVLLEPGWHKFVVMNENSYPGLWINDGQDTKQMLVSDFFSPDDVKTKVFEVDKEGKPYSFLLGAWFQDGKERDDVRLSSEIFGATPLKGKPAGAVIFSGDNSMVLVRELSQTSEDITLSMWIKPETLKGTQYLWNRQKTGWVYTQRGGVALTLVNDQLCVNFHGRNRPPKHGKLEAGKWHHVALTIKSDKPNARALAELWLDGSKIYSVMHPYQLNLTSYYIELFAQVDRAETDPRTTATLSYEDVMKDNLLKNCYKGASADVRIYDAVLGAEAIRRLGK